MFNPSALVGAIMFAWMPEDENPSRPGPKYRPVLVVSADPATKRLLVAYGTSRRVERNGKGELTIRREEINGLSCDTKFCLRNSKWIPLADAYLLDNKTKKPTVLGTIPRNRRDDLIDRLREVF